MKYWRKPLDYDQTAIPRGEVVIIADRCKGCGFCVEYCPKEVLALSEEFNRKGYHPPEVIKQGQCVNCNLCEMICPDFAIFSVAVDDGTSTQVADRSTKTATATATATASATASAGASVDEQRRTAIES